MSIICHVQPCDQVFNLSHYCVKLDAYRSCGSGDKTLLFCNVTPHNRMIYGTCDLVSRGPSN